MIMMITTIITMMIIKLMITITLAIPFLGYSFFKTLTLKSKVKVIAQDHIWGPISYYTHILFVLSQLSLPFLIYSIFRIWPWWQSKVRSWMTPHLFRSMSIGHAIPGLQLFQNLILKIQGLGHNSVIRSVQLPIISYHFCSMSIGYPIRGIQLFSKSDLENPRSR